LRASLLAPQHWHTWFGLGVLRALEMLPYPRLLGAGRVLGRIARRLPLRYVSIARRNIALCLPELSAAEREDLLRRHFDQLGISLCESAMAWWSTDEKILAMSRVEGLEHLDQAQAEGHGVILLTAHFTTLEIGARILSGIRPIHVLYRAPKNAVLAEVTAQQRKIRARGAILRDDIRTMIRVLNANEIVWYAPDQSYRKKGAAMVEFFGVPAATNLFTSRIATMTGAKVLFFSHERLPDGRGYLLRIQPPSAVYPGESALGDAQVFHRFIEDQVRHAPDQYWWIHRRFKGLSPDYPDYYRRKPVVS
jgi:Kdo2-lipid IVA lauroyltransferase/acyltransferase